ncbi:hypothetical protein BDW22DRAFT_852212 [Trametopsis cervina]|nr:hypothetical protein BDW22DRAFT_852212 [Trametopsis cervina]
MNTTALCAASLATTSVVALSPCPFCALACTHVRTSFPPLSVPPSLPSPPPKLPTPSPIPTHPDLQPPQTALLHGQELQHPCCHLRRTSRPPSVPPSPLAPVHAAHKSTICS